MATIDDLNNTATVTARIQTNHTNNAPVEEVEFLIVMPQSLLITISGGDTRSRVMVQDWLKPAMESAKNE